MYIEQAEMSVNDDKTVSTYCPIVLRGVVMIVEQYSDDFIVLKVHNHKKLHLDARYAIINTDTVLMYNLFNDRSYPLDCNLSLNRYYTYDMVKDIVKMLYFETHY